MTAARVLALILLLAVPAKAATVAEEATQAASDLAAAVEALQAAEGARDRVSALTRTIAAYERGLGGLREALRQAQIRETTLEMQFEAKRARLSQLLGVLTRMERDPAPMLLLHPTGPLGTVRSGMMLAEVTPALQAEAEGLRAELTELRDLRALQVAAGETLTRGLTAAQEARQALSQAISDRTDLPRRFTEDPEALRGLLESADTLDAFASGLSLDANAGAERPFEGALGMLPLPVLGSVIRRADEADASGQRRPGITLAARPRALVTAPWSGTIRYRGPLLDFGNVIVLEPGGGYLLILAGLDTVYGQVGEVVAQGAALGLMGGREPAGSEFLVAVAEGGGASETETLYMELRQGAKPLDPAPWFADLAAR